MWIKDIIQKEYWNLSNKDKIKKLKNNIEAYNLTKVQWK